MNYTFEELKKDLSTGRELTFIYEGQKYSISHGKDGSYLTKHGIGWENFKNYEELLSNATINSCKLQVIWDNIKIESIF